MPELVPIDLPTYREKTAQRHTTWNRLCEHWISVVSVGVGVIGFGKFIIEIFVGPVPNVAILQSLVLVAFSVVLLVAAGILYSRSLRRSRFWYATEFVHAAIHILRDECARQREHRDVEAERQAVREALTAIRVAFSIITGATCRATLKSISDRPDFHYPLDGTIHDVIKSGGLVVTYARDSVTHNIIGGFDDPGVPLSANPRFDEFLKQPRERCVVVPDTKDSSNKMSRTTSNAKYGGELPYLSEIIWPVRALNSRDKKRFDLFGFLVIDCYRKKAFDRRECFDLGAAFSDTFYAFFASLYLPNGNADHAGRAETDVDEVKRREVLLPR